MSALQVRKSVGWWVQVHYRLDTGSDLHWRIRDLVWNEHHARKMTIEVSEAEHAALVKAAKACDREV